MSAASDTPFRTRTVAILVAIGVIGFIGTLLLGAYAPDLQSGRNGGGHALSNSAVGYNALVDLARATGRKPRIVRDPRLFQTADLLIATPERGAVNISAALDNRAYKPTLFVLPKWRTVADPDRSDWVRGVGLLPLSEAIGVLAPGVRFTMERRGGQRGRPLTDIDLPATVALRAPAAMQVITSVKFTAYDDEDEEELAEQRMTPLLTDGRGGILLAKLGRGPRYVLSDPDLINNLGMKDINQAAAALAMLDALDPRPAKGITKGIAFDVSFNGLGRTQSPLKLLFEPPFLAATLTLAAALALIALSASARFGPIVPRGRAIAYGKAALVDNSAALIRKARREAHMGARYAAVVRDRAARIFGASARLNDAALVGYLDTVGTGPRFSDLAEQADTATDRRTVLHAAQALHAWQSKTVRRRK